MIAVKVVVDKYIPFLQESLAGCDVTALSPDEINNASVRDADALIVRTRTLVNRQLLENSHVRFVATATIGTDHLDTAYLDEAGIKWYSSPGCNAQAVCDYIEEALDEWLSSGNTSSPTIGIIGVGHVGNLVREMARYKGMNILLNDPPKGLSTPLQTIAKQSDIITFHTPLQEDTFHLGDEEFFSLCRPHTLIINAARGGVVDEKALLQSCLPYIIDTWEGEPQPDKEVLRNAFRASFHIAGYSLQGKINATQQCLDALSEYFGMPPLTVDEKAVSLQQGSGDTRPGWLERISTELKHHPDQFEQLRKQYKLR